jgi:hypothetical protein
MSADNEKYPMQVCVTKHLQHIISYFKPKEAIRCLTGQRNY